MYSKQLYGHWHVKANVITTLYLSSLYYFNLKIIVCIADEVRNSISSDQAFSSSYMKPTLQNEFYVSFDFGTH